jgi:RNA polymerase sigma factor (sigma-70 family)
MPSVVELEVGDDAALIQRVRAGDRTAYDELYARHAPMARRFAASKLLDRADVEDLVSDVFASILGALEAGRGPTVLFAPYLMSSVRNACVRANRRRGRELACAGGTEALTDLAGGDGRDPFDAVDEAGIVRDAFRTLPPRMQQLLWSIEVEDVDYDALADRLRTTPHNVAVMASRARRALAAAYLARHMDAAPTPEVPAPCRAVRPHLVALVRGSAGRRRVRQVEDHLTSCGFCRQVRADLGQLNRHLRSANALPLAVLGASGGLGSALKAKLAVLWSAAAPVAASGAAAITVVVPHPAPFATTMAGPAPPAPAPVVVLAADPPPADPPAGAATPAPPVSTAPRAPAPRSDATDDPPDHPPARKRPAATAAPTPDPATPGARASAPGHTKRDVTTTAAPGRSAAAPGRSAAAPGHTKRVDGTPPGHAVDTPGHARHGHG